MHDPVMLRKLVDAHMHLQEEVLEGHVVQVMDRARAAGVGCMVCNGTHEGDWQRVFELSRQFPEVVPCFGLHPWFVTQRSANWLDALEGYLMKAPSAVGETGLDRWLRERDEPAQEEVFRAQLALANRLGRPVVIHCLRAWGWLMDVLGELGPPECGMHLHAYGGPPDLLEHFTRLGAYFSFAGNVLDERKKRARASLLAVPANRLLIETDAPAMTPPEPFRLHVIEGEDGKPLNEPANLPSILRGIAELRQIPPEELAAITRDNAQRFLGDIWCQTRDS